MEPSLQAAYDAQRNFDKKAFRSGCYAPFVSMYLNTFGEVLACCQNGTYPLGNVSVERLPDIWRGQRTKTLRKALTRYRFEAGCEFCEWQIVGGNHQGAFPALFEEWAVESPDPEWPAFVEFAGSNTCNFECVMCSGEFSSSIRARREGLPPLPKVYNDQFFGDLRQFLPHLRMAKFLGGEPFLAEECFRIWDMVLQDGLTLPCHVTTNGSQYNARVERVLKALPISLSISLDGATRETVESIRVNANFEEFLANVRRFREYTKERGTYMGFSHCLMRQNWHEFGDVLLLAESMGCQVFVNSVLSPDECSLYTLAPDEILRITDEMEKQWSRLERHLTINRGTWESQLSGLRSNARGRMTKDLDKFQAAIFEAWEEGGGGPRGHINIAWKLIGKGRYAEALAEVLKTPESNPNFYDSLALSAHIRFLMGDFEGAERDADRGLRLSRPLPWFFVLRARLRARQGQVSEAMADILHAREIAKRPDEVEAIRETLAQLQGGSNPAAGLVQLKPPTPGS